MFEFSNGRGVAFSPLFPALADISGLHSWNRNCTHLLPGGARWR